MTDRRYVSDFVRVMVERGYLHQATDLEGLDERLNQGTVAGYIGFDCTAKSLHVGSLVQIMMLRWLQKTGHKPIVLLGGGTTRIGDPTGRDEARKMLDDAAIAENMAGIRQVFD
jgi:tyrosyl-tRNA synthetase